MMAQSLLETMARVTQFCFPLLMVATIVVVFARKAGSRFLEKNDGVKAAYERIVAAGPKEGWSGYVILALVCVWLAAMAVLVLVSIDAGDPRRLRG